MFQQAKKPSHATVPLKRLEYMLAKKGTVSWDLLPVYNDVPYCGAFIITNFIWKFA